MNGNTYFNMRSYDTFRNLFNFPQVLPKERTEHSDLQNNLKSWGHLLSFLSQIFGKLMHFMSQTSLSPKLVSFFARFIPKEILTQPEILLCLVEIIFLLLHRNHWAKSRNLRNNFFDPKLISVIIALFNFHQFLSTLSTQCSL